VTVRIINIQTDSPQIKMLTETNPVAAKEPHLKLPENTFVGSSSFTNRIHEKPINEIDFRVESQP
jgi:hypothetical protein